MLKQLAVKLSGRRRCALSHTLQRNDRQEKSSRSSLQTASCHASKRSANLISATKETYLASEKEERICRMLANTYRKRTRPRWRGGPLMKARAAKYSHRERKCLIRPSPSDEIRKHPKLAAWLMTCSSVLAIGRQLRQYGYGIWERCNYAQVLAGMRCLCRNLWLTSQKAYREDAEPADDELIGWDSTQLPGALL